MKQSQKCFTKHYQKRAGFTLIELLVVIAVIGLLSTMTMVSLTSVRGKARDARRMSDISQIRLGLEMYNNENAEYPKEAAAVAIGNGTHATMTKKSLCAGSGFTAPCTGSAFLPMVPRDPGKQAGDIAAACAAQETSCDYSYKSDGSTYQIQFKTEGNPDGSGPLLAGHNCAKSEGLNSGVCQP